MISANDYLGLTHDPRVIEAACHAIARWGTGTGGSRLLCGNTTQHEELETRLAAFVGKRHAIINTTGFAANVGSIGSLVAPNDVILCDRENHASIFAGSQASQASVLPYAHNDAQAAQKRVDLAKRKYPDCSKFLITEGVFSMSGDISTALPELIALKRAHQNLYIYLDDAHGLGVMGTGGRGTAQHFGITKDVDFIMGTFTKALASIGGFIAGDDQDILTYLRHNAKGLIFSTALPVGNVAAVLKCLSIIEQEPERLARLWQITRYVRDRYRDIGFRIGNSGSPIIPIHIGSEEKAVKFAAALGREGVFALPILYPAVPKGQALIRTAFMSTHTDKQIEIVLSALDKVATQYRVRAFDTPEKGTFLGFLNKEDKNSMSA